MVKLGLILIRERLLLDRLGIHRSCINRALNIQLDRLGVTARLSLTGVLNWLSIWRSLLYSFLTGRAWCTDYRGLGQTLQKVDAYVQILIRQSLSWTGSVHRWLDWDFGWDSLSTFTWLDRVLARQVCFTNYTVLYWDIEVDGTVLVRAPD
jgi:hypothetical protein